jgi:hypothetical protein
MAKRSRKKKARAEESSPPWFRRDWFWGLVLIGAVIAAYQPVWFAGFIWDDSGRITQNPCIVGPLGLKEIWTTAAADICPLTLTTFWLEHALFDLAPLPYHLVTVLQHAACAVVLWRVLRMLAVPGAWLGAALWALHPVMVDSVAWISETKNTQSGLFYLLAILFFIRWHRARGGWNYGLVLLFAALAMLSKTSTVILPLALGLCAGWLRDRRPWRTLLAIAPVLAMAGVAALVTMITQKAGGGEDPQWVRTWPERLATAGDSVWFYLGKLLWPHPLVAVYPRWPIDTGQWSAYLPSLAVIAVGAVLWRARGSWARPWFFAFAYFVAALLPVLGFVDQYFQRFSYVADHFQYLAAMGPLALAGAGLARLADRVVARPAPWWPWAAGAALLLALAFLSWRRAWIYQSDEVLWADTLARNPGSWVAHYNQGITDFERGQIDASIAEFRTSVGMNPNYSESQDDLGCALEQKGEMEEAVARIQRAIEIEPGNAQAHNNLAVALIRLRRWNEAAAECEAALRLVPTYAVARQNLAAAQAGAREFPEGK